jgi:hypothetical protein
LGQALVAFVGVAWLPIMEQWFSGLIPYPTLLMIQLLMLILMVKITGEIWRGVGTFAIRRPHCSQFLIRLSAIYAGAMVLRYVLTMILHPEMRWLGMSSQLFFISCWPGSYSCLASFIGAHSDCMDKHRVLETC